MNSYILLRNNKESGPHSFEQITAMGLRANDLIWVEGQSAAWRNPGEIKELKDLVSQSSSPVPLRNEPKENSSENITPTPATSPVKQAKVFVEMPVQPKTVISDEKYMPQASTSHPIEDKKETTKDEVKVETKYAMSMDEIKERYVKSLEDNRRKHRKLKIKFPPWLVRAAVYTGLVGVGAVTVWLLKDPGKVKVMSQQQPSILPQKFDVRPDTVDENYAMNSETGETATSGSYEDQQRGVNNRSSLVGDKRIDQNNTGRTVKRLPESSTQDEEQPIKNDRISIPKNEVAEIRTISTADLSDQVSVKTNAYTIAALGGIRNLELTLQNDSRYTLDNVLVELRYLNPAGVILKTEDVHFKSVQPSGSQTVAIKKTNRGVKVSCKVMKIESKDVGSTAGL